MDPTGAGKGVETPRPRCLIPPVYPPSSCVCGLCIWRCHCVGGVCGVGLGVGLSGQRVCGCSSGELGLEFASFGGAERVSGADDVGAVGVSAGIEGVQEMKHFGGVAAAAEDDEDVGGAGTGMNGRVGARLEVEKLA